jgi:hypothetical protein
MPKHINLVKQYNDSSSNNRITRMRLSRYGTLSSKATSILDDVLGFDPSGCNDYAPNASLFDEFRVRALKVHLVPYQQGSVTAKNDLVAMVFDNDNSSAITTLAAALDYGTVHTFSSIWYSHTGETKSYYFERPTSGKDTAIAWVDVDNPAASIGSVKFFAQSLTASLQYFTFYIEYFVEFRGRR